MSEYGNAYLYNMKYILSASISLLFVFGSCSSAGTSESTQEQVVHINGSITGTDAAMIYLLAERERKLVPIDSAVIEGGSFSLSDELPQTEMIFMQYVGQPDYFRVFAEPGNITVKADANRVAMLEVKGSAAHDLYNRAMDVIQPFDAEMQRLLAPLSNPKVVMNQSVQDSISALSDDIYERQNAAIYAFVQEHLGSPVAAYLFNRYLIFDIEYEELVEMSTAYAELQPDSRYTAMLTERAALLANSAVGTTAPDFGLPDRDGDTIKLSDWRGSVVLIDFWASWCGPCRKENPEMVQLYREYHPRGLEILGVSFDNSADAWQKAIQDDQLNWIHVSDLNGWSSSAGALYGINSIPHTVLVDKEGKVVAHKLKGDALRAELEKLL